MSAAKPLPSPKRQAVWGADELAREAPDAGLASAPADGHMHLVGHTKFGVCITKHGIHSILGDSLKGAHVHAEMCTCSGAQMVGTCFRWPRRPRTRCARPREAAAPDVHGHEDRTIASIIGAVIIDADDHPWSVVRGMHPLPSPHPTLPHPTTPDHPQTPTCAKFEVDVHEGDGVQGAPHSHCHKAPGSQNAMKLGQCLAVAGHEHQACIKKREALKFREAPHHELG
jgi:hypothetical protein